MSDTSNKFSLNGLNRQKKISGLHFRRPENVSTYFNRVSLNTPPMYVRVLGVDILSYGNDQYSVNTKVVFPQPEHPNGYRAQGYVILELTKNSFSVSNGGSGFSLYDTFDILNSSSELVGSFVVTQVSGSGGILDFSIIPYPNDFLTSSQTIDFGSNNTATVVFNPDYCKLGQIYLTNFGHGYQTFHEVSGQQIIHSVTLTNTGNGANHNIVTTHQPLVVSEYDNDRKLLEYKNQYGKIVNYYKRPLCSMHIILNDTLQQPPELIPFYSKNAQWNSVGFTGSGTLKNKYVKEFLDQGAADGPDGISARITSSGYVHIFADRIDADNAFRIRKNSTPLFYGGDDSGYGESFFYYSFPVSSNDYIYIGTESAYIGYTNLRIWWTQNNS